MLTRAASPTSQLISSHSKPTKSSRARQGFLGAGLPLLLLAGCATSSQVTDDRSPESATETTSSAEVPVEAPTEVNAVSPRLAITYDGGIQLFDALTLEAVETIELGGFNRLNDAGDGRHLFVSTTGGFQLLDSGTWAEAHGDHAHYYTSSPTLTDTTFEAQTPGHVVVHAGRTALFDDGTGQVLVLDSNKLITEEANLREFITPSEHHGVAVELTDGTLIVSDGTPDQRTGVQVLDREDNLMAASNQCPGIHGEAVAANEAVVVGCEDGVLLVKDSEVTKISSPDVYGRIGNQAGSPVSSVILGDYKSDPDATPTQISLIDTELETLTLVDLPSSYTFRSFARGDDGDGLVLGTDGQIHVIDPEAKEVSRSIPVLDAWEEPTEWQTPRPAILALDGSVYITDPATNTLFAVDIETGQVWNSTSLEVTPNELSGVSGNVEGGSDTDGHDHDHDHNH